MATYRCDKHQSDIEGGAACSACVQAFKNRRDASTMTGEERAAELRWWEGIVTIPFSDLLQRITELVGRPVFTHELAGDAAFALLLEEARTQQHISLDEMLDKVPAENRIVVYAAPEAAVDPAAAATSAGPEEEGL